MMSDKRIAPQATFAGFLSLPHIIDNVSSLC